MGIILSKFLTAKVLPLNAEGLYFLLGFAPFVLLSPQIVGMRILKGIDISVICFYVIMFFVASKTFDSNVKTNSKKSTLIIIGWVFWAVAKLCIYIIPFIIAKNTPIIFAEDTLSLFINPLFYIQSVSTNHHHYKG